MHTKGRSANGKGPFLSSARAAQLYKMLMGDSEAVAAAAALPTDASTSTVTTISHAHWTKSVTDVAPAAVDVAEWNAKVTTVATDALASGRSVATELQVTLDDAAAMAAAAVAGAHPPPDADRTYNPTCQPGSPAVVLPPTVRVAAATAAARVGDAPAAAAALLHNVPPHSGTGVHPNVAASILASAHLRAGLPRRALDVHLGAGGTDLGSIPATADAVVWGQVVSAAAAGGWWAEARRALLLARARGVRPLSERTYAVTLLPRKEGAGGSIGAEAAWALDLVGMMAADGVTPSTRTIVAVVTAISRAGDHVAAQRIADDAGFDKILSTAVDRATMGGEGGDSAAVMRDVPNIAVEGERAAAMSPPAAAPSDDVQRVAVALMAIAAARRDMHGATDIWERLVTAMAKDTPNVQVASAYVRALAHGLTPWWIQAAPITGGGASLLPSSAATTSLALTDTAAAVAAAWAVLSTFPSPPPQSLADKFVFLLGRAGSSPAALADVLPRLYPDGVPSAPALVTLLWCATATHSRLGNAASLTAADLAAVRVWVAAASATLSTSGRPPLLCATAGALVAVGDAPAAVDLLVAHSGVGVGTAEAGRKAAAWRRPRGPSPVEAAATPGIAGVAAAHRWAMLFRALVGKAPEGEEDGGKRRNAEVMSRLVAAGYGPTMRAALARSEEERESGGRRKRDPRRVPRKMQGFNWWK